MSKKQERHFFRVKKYGQDRIALVPSSRLDQDYISDYADGSMLEVSLHKGRSRPRNRLYWATLHAVCENHELITSAESLHKMLLIGTGTTEPLVTIDGDIVLLPASTAFDNLSEPDFKTFFDNAMRIIVTQILPGVDLNKLLDEAKKRSDTGERHAA